MKLGWVITAIELMPVADFPGRWNWGYDGAFLYAPDSSYGRPEHLKALIGRAHALGLCVILDVVYNHFGPEGNYLQTYAPIVNPDRHTPWGGTSIALSRTLTMKRDGSSAGWMVSHGFTTRSGAMMCTTVCTMR